MIRQHHPQTFIINLINPVEDYLSGFHWFSFLISHFKKNIKIILILVTIN